MPLQQAVLAIKQETDVQKLADLNKTLEAVKKLDSTNRQHANHWATLAIFSAKQLGAAIKLGQERGEIAGNGRGKQERSHRLTLEQIVPNKNYASRCYKLMEVADDTVWEYKAKCDEEEEQVTKVGMLRYVASPTIATKMTGNEEAYTPEAYIEAAREVMGDIDLDPASCPLAQETVQASTYYTKEQDGLSKPWAGCVWLNPPYTALLINKFVDKLIEEYEAKRIAQAVLLTNNNTDTSWFHNALASAGVCCLTKGRIGFNTPEGGVSAPTNGQTFFYFGARKKSFARTFSEFGAIVNVAKS